jgi:predicted AlkP superfamily pyrophosphatase or phosphodiesterase
MFKYVDYTGHKYGPDSPEMAEKLKYLDKTLGYLIEQFEKHDLTESMNVVITSDHGMEAVKKDPLIVIADYVDTNLFDMYGSYDKWDLFLKNRN